MLQVNVNRKFDVHIYKISADVYNIVNLSQNMF